MMASQDTNDPQEILRTALASIGDGVITTDAGGRITYMNAVAESLVGWRLDEAAGQPLEKVFRIVNERTCALAESPVEKVLRQGFVVGLANHTTLIAKDGTERPIDDSAAPIRDERGHIAGCVLVFRDITDRRRVEIALERSERELADFFANANVGLHWVGPDGTILRVNRAQLEMFGYREEEYVGRNIAEFHVDQPVIESILDRLLRGETLSKYPAQMRCKDGSVKDVLINTNGLWEEGKFIHSRCFTLDVTERKRAEEARTLLAAIVSDSDDAIVSKTLDGTIRSWNAAAERLFGHAASEAVGQSINLIIPAELRDEEAAILQRLRRGERIHHFETVRVAKNGRRIDISLTISPVSDDAGRIVGASKVARDITDRKHTETVLREAEQRKDEFLAALGHELRNPLAPLRTGVELLNRADTNPELVASVRAMMDRQIRHLTRLVDDLLDVARITSGKLRVERVRLDLRGVIEAAVELTSPLIDEHGHELDLQLAEHPLPIDGDFERLTQVLGNLLNNAARYMRPGGTIELRAEADGGQAVVRVKDTGFGIPTERLGTLFGMYSQVPEHEAHTGGGGIGIGLALSRRLLALHEGTIEARSEGLGHGSEFTVRLPLAASDEPAAGAAGRRSRGPAPPQRVLVVDDNADVAESLRIALELDGHAATTAHDGPAALAAMERFAPSAVLLDIGLPGMDGYEVAQRIRVLPGGRDVLLIAVTGWGQDEDRRRAQAAGFDAHVTKPVEGEALSALLAKGAFGKD